MLLSLVFALWIACGLFCAVASPASELAANRILIQPKSGVNSNQLAAFHAEQKTKVLRTFRTGIEVLLVPEGRSASDLISAYQNSGLVQFAESNRIFHASATLPDDPAFQTGNLWPLFNTGQTGGLVGADIHAPEAWDLQTSASNVIVAILDTGVRFTHEDLAANIWVNTNDGTHGFNAFTNAEPEDDKGHGTFVAGIIGAVGSNSLGTVGVAWQVQMMPCKCLDDTGEGTDENVIACLEFAQTNGAQIINASFSKYTPSDAVSNTLSSLRDSGIIIVAPSDEHLPADDLDIEPRYPACYDLDNIVAVSATDDSDMPWPLANYGATTVDLFAPGILLYSTSFEADDAYSPTNYPDDNIYGTSFSTAYVSGALALIKARFPNEDYRMTIERLFRGTDSLPQLAGLCVTGGRLNLLKALSPTIELLPLSNTIDPFQMRVCGGFNRTFVTEVSTNLFDWTAIATNCTTTNWSFDFTDDQATNSCQQFYRVVSAP